MKRIIITGATGMIGSAIVRQALKHDYEITCLVRKNSTRISNVPKNDRVHIINCDISDYKTLELAGTYDVFMHLAWNKTSVGGRDDVECQFKNIEYTLDAVRLAQRCGCSVFIGAGSQAEYGIQTVSLTPDLPVNPESGYGIAKYAAGKFARMLCKQFGMRFNWIRILSIYGPNDGENTLISYVIRELKVGRSPELTKCEQIWDYLYCDDAAEAFLAIGEKGVDGKFYPLGSGQGMMLANYIEDIKQIINPAVHLGFGKKDYYPHQPMYLVADITELSVDTEWVSKISFTEGIKSIL